MEEYLKSARHEMEFWQYKMLKGPSFFDKATKIIQDRINKVIPEKVHQAITAVIREMVKAVLFGAEHTTQEPKENASLFLREAFVKERIEFYKKTAATEGAITGAGGILMGLADFPLLLAIKIKFLYEVAALYGYDLSDYKERVYVLHIFQLAFSSQQERKKVAQKVFDWEKVSGELPDDIKEFDWRTFQQQYRDYIDLAKLAQLVPVIGAAVGAVVNYKLLKHLGDTAINAYRLRYFSLQDSQTVATRA